MEKDRQLLTPQDVARRLQLNIVTIYGYIRSKKILATKFGRKYRISPSDLDKFIKINETF
jgi:excisionase family DNA binding protein